MMTPFCPHRMITLYTMQTFITKYTAPNTEARRRKQRLTTAPRHMKPTNVMNEMGRLLLHT
jgi:hypothetical protein